MTNTFTTQTNTNGSRSSAQALENRIAELQSALTTKDAEQKYSQLLHTIRDLVQICIPKESIVLAISKGDDDLVDWRGRCGWHFPQAADGTYAGYHPASSAEAIAHLEELRSRGAGYLLIPRDAFWWLEFYSEFTQHLQSTYRIATYQENVCIVYCLSKTS